MKTVLMVDKFMEGGKVCLRLQRGKNTYAAMMTEDEARCLAAELNRHASTLAAFRGWEMVVEKCECK